jgi:hypothetical protein
VLFWTLSIVHILIKLLRFGSWIFFRLRVKRGRTETLAVGLPGWASLNKITTFRKLDQLEFLFSPFLPEDWRRSSFRNVVILLRYRRWTMSKKALLQIITHHRQNPLDFIYIRRLSHFSRVYLILTNARFLYTAVINHVWINTAKGSQFCINYDACFIFGSITLMNCRENKA